MAKVTVAVHDFEIRQQGGQQADVRDAGGSTLTFRLGSDANMRGVRMEYCIGWDSENKGGAQMDLQDPDGNDEAYNPEWGGVVPATQCFQPH